MIKIDRSRISAPSALSDVAGAGPSETKANIDGYAEFLQRMSAATGSAKEQKEFEFRFEAYGRRDVREALTALFYGKCAYCEKRFAATQPVDVEHWRPKGRITRDDGTTAVGYYWLAARWDNLLPSCIDCNRPRKQSTPFSDKPETLGKSDQFPVWREQDRWNDPNGTNLEKPLILNPYFDDPAEVIEFTDEGVVRPRPEPQDSLPGPTLKELGEASIRVYALNRMALVNERCALVKRIDRIKLTVIYLMRLLAGLKTFDERERTAIDEQLIEQVIDQELEHLASLMQPESEFSGVARGRIEDFLKALGLKLPAHD